MTTPEVSRAWGQIAERAWGNLLWQAEYGELAAREAIAHLAGHYGQGCYDWPPTDYSLETARTEYLRQYLED